MKKFSLLCAHVIVMLLLYAVTTYAAGNFNNSKTPVANSSDMTSKKNALSNATDDISINPSTGEVKALEKTDTLEISEETKNNEINEPDAPIVTAENILKTNKTGKYNPVETLPAKAPESNYVSEERRETKNNFQHISSGVYIFLIIILFLNFYIVFKINVISDASKLSMFLLKKFKKMGLDISKNKKSDENEEKITNLNNFMEMIINNDLNKTILHFKSMINSFNDEYIKKSVAIESNIISYMEEKFKISGDFNRNIEKFNNEYFKALKESFDIFVVKINDMKSKDLSEFEKSVNSIMEYIEKLKTENFNDICRNLENVSNSLSSLETNISTTIGDHNKNIFELISNIDNIVRSNSGEKTMGDKMNKLTEGIKDALLSYRNTITHISETLNQITAEFSKLLKDNEKIKSIISEELSVSISEVKENINNVNVKIEFDNNELSKQIKSIKTTSCDTKTFIEKLIVPLTKFYSDLLTKIESNMADISKSVLINFERDDIKLISGIAEIISMPEIVKLAGKANTEYAKDIVDLSNVIDLAKKFKPDPELYRSEALKQSIEYFILNYSPEKISSAASSESDTAKDIQTCYERIKKRLLDSGADKIDALTNDSLDKLKEFEKFITEILMEKIVLPAYRDLDYKKKIKNIKDDDSSTLEHLKVLFIKLNSLIKMKFGREYFFIQKSSKYDSIENKNYVSEKYIPAGDDEGKYMDKNEIVDITIECYKDISTGQFRKATAKVKIN